MKIINLILIKIIFNNTSKAIFVTALIGLSFSSNIFADELIDKNKGCKIFNANPTKNSLEEVYWSGPCVNGFAEGIGELQWLLNGEKTDRYEGNMARGKFFGKGKLKLKNGDEYEGSFKDGMPDGIGEYRYSSGSKYIGEFRSGLFDGNGIFLSANGNEYIGSFKNSKRNGAGKLKLKNGDYFEGNFKDGAMHGSGRYIFQKGDEYVGDFNNGNLEGKGTLKYANGMIYAGDFKNGKINGMGILKNPSGQEFIGNWKDGKKHGKVTLNLKDCFFSAFWEDGKFIRIAEDDVNNKNFCNNVGITYTEKININYPRMSQRLAESGTVTLQVNITASGVTGEVKVIKSSGYPRLDNAAIEAAKDWTFSPEIKNRKPIDTWKNVDVTFNLR